jgi:hypothetical protein
LDYTVASRQTITEALGLIFQGIARLKHVFPSRAFTIDGRLVGDIGEVIASIEYEVGLDEVSQPGHDGMTSNGRRVQVKATFKDHLSFRTTPDYYLGFRLFQGGQYEEVFNGPGHVIRDRYAHRKNLGTTLLSFPVSELKELSRRAAAVPLGIRSKNFGTAMVVLALLGDKAPLPPKYTKE